MQCRNCGTEIAEKALICYRCGTPTTEAKYKPYEPGARRTSSAFIVAGVLTLVALLVLLAFFLLNSTP